MKQKQHVKLFEAFRNDLKNKINEADASKLTDEQLKDDYGAALLYLRVLENGDTFSKFIEKIDTVNDLEEALENMLPHEERYKLKDLLNHVLRIFLQCIFPDFNITGDWETAYRTIKYGYTRTVRSKRTTYKRAVIYLKKGDKKIAVRAKSVLDDKKAKFPEEMILSYYWTKDQNKDSYTSYKTIKFKDIMENEKLNSSEISKRIKQNFKKVISDSDFKDIVKSMQLAKKEVEKGEDNIVQKAKRGVQDFLGAFGL